jgi:hypothetical protein
MILTQESDINDARVGYQAAVSLWVYEGKLIWAKYNAMLVANSVILAVYGVALGSSQRLPSAFVTGLPIAGVTLCFLWAIPTKRGFDNYAYWIACVRELEEAHLTPTVRTVSRGGPFADGRVVTVTIDGQSNAYSMSRVSRLLRASWSSYIEAFRKLIFGSAGTG